MSRINLLVIYSYLLTSFIFNNVQSLDSENIIGGREATKGQFPYLVSIEMYGTSICGGGIIDESHVVTAGHCVIDSETNDFQKHPFKVVGATNDVERKDSTKVSSYVEKMFVPAIYIETLNDKVTIGDIAVLKLKTPLNLEKNPYLSKLDLPDPKTTYANETALISGYGFNYIKVVKSEITGRHEETGGYSLGKLRFARTTVLSNEECQKSYKWMIDEDYICARVVQPKDSRPEGVCSGDSGGPLVHKGKTLIGVVSTSPTGCREDVAAAIYTRVSRYLSFIDKARKNITSKTVLGKTIVTRSRYSS